MLAELGADLDLDTDAPFDLTQQTGGLALVRLHAATREFPEQREYGVRVALGDEVAALVLDHGGHHADHLFRHRGDYRCFPSECNVRRLPVSSAGNADP